MESLDQAGILSVLIEIGLYVLAFFLPLPIAILINRKFPNDRAIASGILLGVKFKAIGASATYLILVLLFFSFAVPAVDGRINMLSEERWKVSLEIEGLLDDNNVLKEIPVGSLGKVNILTENPPVFEANTNNRQITFFLGKLSEHPNVTVKYGSYQRILTIEDSQKNHAERKINLGQVSLSHFDDKGSGSITSLSGGQ